MTPGRPDGHAPVRAALTGPRAWLLVATIALGGAGWGFTALIYGAADPEARALRLAGGLAAATVAAPAWYLLVTRPGRRTLPRGAVAGLLAGTVSYPLFWTYGLALTEAAKGRPEWAVAGLGIGLLFGVTVGLFGLIFAPFSGVVGLLTGVCVVVLSRRFAGTGGTGGDDDPGPTDSGGETAVDPADPSATGRTAPDGTGTGPESP